MICGGGGGCLRLLKNFVQCHFIISDIFFSSLESGCHEEKMKIAKTVLSHAILLWLFGKQPKDFLEVYIKVMCKQQSYFSSHRMCGQYNDTLPFTCNFLS